MCVVCVRTIGDELHDLCPYNIISFQCYNAVSGVMRRMCRSRVQPKYSHDEKRSRNVVRSHIIRRRHSFKSKLVTAAIHQLPRRRVVEVEFLAERTSEHFPSSDCSVRLQCGWTVCWNCQTLSRGDQSNGLKTAFRVQIYLTKSHLYVNYKYYSSH